MLTLKCDNGLRIEMRAFEHVLIDISGKSLTNEITPKDLIKAKPFTAVCCDGIITSASPLQDMKL